MSSIVTPESSYKPYACRTTQSFPQTADWFPVSPADSGLIPSISCRHHTGFQYLRQTAPLTCRTALMSRRSSVGFQRPRSLVICSGCLLFFTLLAMGGGVTTMVRGGVSVVLDFVT